MHAGRRGPVDHPAGGEHQLQAIKVVVDPLDDGEDAEQEGDLGLHRRRDPLARTLEADAPAEILGHGRDQEHHDHRFEGPPEQELDERQLEDVEADIVVPLLVGGAEAHAVAEQIEVVPLRVGADPGKQSEDDSRDDAHPLADRPDNVAVTADELIGRVVGELGRSESVGDHQADDIITKKTRQKVTARSTLVTSTPRNTDVKPTSSNQR